MFFPICPLSFYIWLDLICIDWKLSMLITLQIALIFQFITHYPCFEEVVPYPLFILWRFRPLPIVHDVKRFNVHLVRLNSHWLKIVHFDYFANKDFPIYYPSSMLWRRSPLPTIHLVKILVSITCYLCYEDFVHYPLSMMLKSSMCIWLD